MAVLLNPKVWIGLVLAAVLAFAGVFIWKAGHASLRGEFDAYRLAQTQALQQADAAYHAKEQEWQASADQTTKAKDEAIQNIHARLDDALGKLRDHPLRPASGAVPSTACDGKGAIGARIYAEDAGFLVRESARADELRTAPGACYAQYDAPTK